MHRFFGDFGLGKPQEAAEEWTYERLFSIAPYWNAFFRSNPRWIAFGLVIGVFYAALVKKVIDGLVDWMHGR